MIMKIIKTLLCVFILIFESSLLFINAQDSICIDNYSIEDKYNWATKNSRILSAKSYELLQECYIYFQQNQDTSSVINCLFTMSDISLYELKHAQSFDHSCEALYLSEAAKNYPSQSVSHRRLALIYTFYGMDEASMSHIEKAIETSKKVSDTGIYPNIQHGISSFHLAGKKRLLGNPKEALDIMNSIHLDSLYEDNVPWFIADYELELAKIYIDLQEYKLAYNHIHEALVRNNGENLAIILSSIKLKGDIALKQNNNNEAIKLYNEALNFCMQNNISDEYESDIHLNLSKIYASSYQYKKAHSELSITKHINDSIQRERLKSSNKIFEISNKYQASLLEKQATIMHKDKIIQTKTTTQYRLSIIIALLTLLVVALIVVFGMQHRLRKTIIEKKKAELQVQVEIEKSEIEVNAKNKELASYALQLIDKENNLKELLSTLKDVSPEEYKKQKNKYIVSKQSLWDEFNIRFTEVNKGFYHRLLLQYPDLSRTEQKHCAFIKLNFSTKEISHILNVEMQTINMSRSRIRKKMGLGRSESLSSVIGRI